MPYSPGGHSGAVAISSYSKNSMAPLSPTLTRRFNSTSSATPSIATKTSKFRLDTTYSDRCSSFPITTNSHSRMSDYRRHSSIKSGTSSSLSDTSYLTSRYGTSTLRSVPLTFNSTVDIYNKYSPAHYKPQTSPTSSSGSLHRKATGGATSASSDDCSSSSSSSASNSRANSWTPTQKRQSPQLQDPTVEVTTNNNDDRDALRRSTNNNNNDPDTSDSDSSDRDSSDPDSSDAHNPLSFQHNFPTNTDNLDFLVNNNDRFAKCKPPSELDSDDEVTTKERLLEFEPEAAASYADDPAVPSTSRRPDSLAPSDDPREGPSSPSVRAQTYRFDDLEAGTSRSTANRHTRDDRRGLTGLRNIGNTCFMNSVIQCLSNTRPLLDYLLNDKYKDDINTTTSGMKGALIKAFSEVIHELWEAGGDHVVNTSALKSQIQRFAPRFIGYSQQDAQEFLRYLLEGLHEDVNRVKAKPQPIHTDIPDHYSDSEKAKESWKRYLRSEDSSIVDIFVGQLRSSLRCTSCDHVSVTLDPFWDLSLPIPARSGTVKLNQCLVHFTKEEVLDGDEKPTCSKCQMRKKCIKSFSIQKFPKILVIHLKRFSPMERFRGKLNVLVDFPLSNLDLSEFAAPKVAGCTYSLYGVANHSGTTYSGHYTAYCKHPYSGEWHEYNDNRVSSVPGRSVVSSEGYVLFYEQQPTSSHL